MTDKKVKYAWNIDGSDKWMGEDFETVDDAIKNFWKVYHYKHFEKTGEFLKYLYIGKVVTKNERTKTEWIKLHNAVNGFEVPE